MSEVVFWEDDGTPRSTRFDDFYRPPTGGLAQARHVFLQGCGLPAAWAGSAQWRILETGFGLGLNFLAAWHAWREDAARPQLLHFVSIEGWPVAPGDLVRSVAAWPELQPLAEALAAQWSGLMPGVHRLSFEGGRVLLTLCVGPVEPMLRSLAFAADSVFLDGFDPQVNPEMWAPATVKAVARLARRGTRAATWCVTGELRGGLPAAGFRVEKVDGLPPKRHRLQAVFDPAWALKRTFPLAPPAQDAVVIGAGLAGAAVAASLARRGWRVRVLDAGEAPAAGASGLPAGLMAPHQSPDDNLLSRLSRSGIRITWQEAESLLLRGRDWDPAGVLEWRGDDRRPPPPLGPELAPWTRVASDEEVARAGVPAGTPAWWHERAAWIRPGALVQAWLAHPDIAFEGGVRVAGLERADAQWIVRDAQGVELARAPVVVVAAALGSAALASAALGSAAWAGSGVRLNPVRGQLTWRRHDEPLALPPHPVNGHGHFLPRLPVGDGHAWVIGSTYGRGDSDTTPRAEDHGLNLQRAGEMLPAVAAQLAPAFAAGDVQAWCGVRCASSDRRPLVGELAPGLWLSTALGSRGLTFAALCAELLAARLHHEPLPLDARLARALALTRLSPSAPDQD